ncbi:P-loop containing nucleoside triphosphate hydrolase protein [Gautieria morchelliformis]|nr:P-loop containing nucleoside triphosphate hydrolase protein [Gautieria morchelliformis]
MDDVRRTRLNKLFDSTIRGQTTITGNRQHATHFLEALCIQPEPVACVHKIVTGKAGLASLQNAMFMQSSVDFFNGLATRVLTYMQLPELADVGDGQMLRQVLLKIVEPSVFWMPFSQAFRSGTLSEKAQLSFAWVMLQLVSLPGDEATPYREEAQDASVINALLGSSQGDIRAVGYKIKHMLDTRGVTLIHDNDYHPGGRHDNDFVDFHEISLMPTADEITSKEVPFLRTSHEVEDSDEGGRLAIHLDNQFRLLREDMLFEMREELQILLGAKKGNHRALVVDGLVLHDMYRDENLDDNRSKKINKWGIVLKCNKDFWFLKGITKPEERKKTLLGDRKRIKHQSFACLIIDDNVVAFPTINRDEEYLSRNPPEIVIQIEGKVATIQTLLRLKNARNVKLCMINTAIFAYEPVLTALKEASSMPLELELIRWADKSPLHRVQSSPQDVIWAIKANPSQDLSGILKTGRPVLLDDAQTSSLLSGLTQRVSLIQGPPGTGKSFIGALLAKVLHDHTAKTILVCCYTNHALDQFLEDLMNVGIPKDHIVRLGGKATPRTEPLTLYNQKQVQKLGRADWFTIDGLKARSTAAFRGLESAFSMYKSSNVTLPNLMDYLEFEEPEFFAAFQLPTLIDSSGMQRVGNRGRAVNPFSLYQRWIAGKDAGWSKDEPSVLAASRIWNMSLTSRREQVTQWQMAILMDHVERLYDTAKSYNKSQTELERKFAEGAGAILRSKRIIGCTTTAAAKYSEDIRAASPGVLLVEEAGEILESHILTALSDKTDQMILIGDHQQLRPKVNHYRLTVEKGEGYDLNRSLFERLILKGYPHRTLCKQHRMRPEIANLVRHLTYPDLVDADSTKNRPNLRGVSNNIVFIDHRKPEDEEMRVVDMQDLGAKSSKRNTHEVLMILKILRYLAQQGYGTDKAVILTPYLGQLQSLRDALQKNNDPILNDLDSYDLVRAGLITQADANSSKQPIRLATIDNYQGEESDIVIVSLTRSNASHDIGFMYSPERLNVLLSRARDALIILGNAETFKMSRKGQELWGRLFDLLKQGGNLYDGLPVRCERHKDRTALLTSPADFDEKCPDGGCREPCGTMLSCGLHPCPSKCHQLYDHSKMKCEFVIDSSCPAGHRKSYRCHEQPDFTCTKCERDKKQAEIKKQKALDRQRKRDAEQLEHAKKLAELDEEIEALRQANQDAQQSQARQNIIRQKERDLEAARTRKAQVASPSAPSNAKATPTIHGNSTASRPETTPSDRETAPIPDEIPRASPMALVSSPSHDEWQRQKMVDGADNEHIDALMEMTGLEMVKEQVLAIKDKIDVSNRQDTSVKDERFHVVLLGNPGTGKTTVARHYAKILTSLNVLPGDEFMETTGSRLANDGVPGTKKLIETVMNAGGGAIFIDEAYQLTSNLGGDRVLEFLLAEMENQVGQIVFILAGYNKQMEKFFEHNPGLTSRVPYRLQFADYTDSELLTMLEKMINKKYKGRMRIEDDTRGLYGRIAIRRLGRGRGKEGFGNARALHNMFAQITERMAKRITRDRKEGLNPDDFLITKEDLIGPDPSRVIVTSKAWNDLQNLTGLKTVKESVRNLFDLINANYKRELQEKNPIEMTLNRVFLGSPGTGKTTVAKLYGQVLADLGLISNGEVIVKNPADFIGSVLGESEKNTKAILANTVGKVLVIDEAKTNLAIAQAYMLYSGKGGAGKQSDPYKTAVIDTIVAEVQSTPGEDRCVLMLGYDAEIKEMFQNVNPGLARRFAIEDAFRFEDFSDPELLEILSLKLKQQDLDATDKAKAVAIEVLSQARNRPNFGNAGEVENLLSKAKNNYQTRQASLPTAQRSFEVVFQPQDFDIDFDRAENSDERLKKLFENVIGCERTIEKLKGYQHIARVMKAKGSDARDLIPTNFVFKGPPGTGKTTTARKMGQVYYDMGFLSSGEVIECSASELVGEYVGQTGPKTQRVFEKALGRVLFIDEAYRLGEGQFAKEAIDEVVGLMTSERFASKIVVILAGYDREMNQLLDVNTGLSSRFPEEIIFEHMSPEHCLEILRKNLKAQDIQVRELEDSSSMAYQDMAKLIRSLSTLPSWGNARDILTLSKQMIITALRNVKPGGSALKLSGEDALACMQKMYSEKRARADNVPSTKPFGGLLQQLPPPPAHHQPSIVTSHATKTAAPKPKREEKGNVEPVGSGERRDADVSDQVWKELLADKRAAIQEAERRENNLQQLDSEIALQAVEEAEQQAQLAQLAHRKEQSQKEYALDDELKRRHEEERLKLLAAKVEREKIVAELEEKRRKALEERKQEAQVQAKLRAMGVCVAGFRWIKQSMGYRCAGGSHFISNAELGL